VSPDAPEVFACAEIECEHLDGRTLQECEKARCCFTFQRSREESAADQARKDEKERMRDHA
jgi:hypothetical protein